MTTFSLAFQNLSGNGSPPVADLVLTCETNFANVVLALGDGYTHIHHPRQHDRELTLSYRDGVFDPGTVLDVEVVTLHRSGLAMRHPIKNFGPWRALLIVRGIVNGERVAFLVTHWVQAAWQHGYIPFRRLRQRLWNRSHRITTQHLAELEAAGYLVILAGDFNRGEHGWGFRKLRDVVTHGLDRLFVSSVLWSKDSKPAITVSDVSAGPHTGHARTTHGSVLATITVRSSRFGK